MLTITYLWYLKNTRKEADEFILMLGVFDLVLASIIMFGGTEIIKTLQMCPG